MVSTRVTILDILGMLGIGHGLRGDTRMRIYILEIFVHKITPLKIPGNIMGDICRVEIIYHNKSGKHD